MAKKKIKKQSNKPKELEGSRVKISFRKHLLPPLMGLFVALLVFGFFNSELLSGKIAYYMYQRRVSVSNQDSITAASAIDKNAPAQLIINKINVSAPIIFDQKTVDEGSFQKALQHGVIHYPDTADPGKMGNVVIFGHSSGQWWAPGDYKFVFTLLDKVRIDDKIFINYQGTRYIYKVFVITVVQPDDLSVLNQGSKNILTLITCTPVGTSNKRLIVKAEQISPKPGSGLQATEAASLPANAHGKLPSSSSSFWHNLRELFN